MARRNLEGAAIMLMGLFSFLSGGCGRRDSQPLPEVTAESDEGFHDLVFQITDTSRETDGAVVLRGLGTYQGARVGLDVILGPAWKRGSLSADVPLVTYTGRVRWRSIGPESDGLLRIMDRLYAANRQPRAMNAETTFAGISLGGNASDLSAGPVKIKLFHESEDGSLYAECFLNIDLKARRLQLNEKDPDYRVPLIRALSEGRSPK